MTKGDETRTRGVRTGESRPPKHRWSLVLLGAGAGSGGAIALHAPPAIAMALGAAVGVAAWAVARVVQLERAGAARALELQDTRAALTRSAQANEERYEELLEAKAEVEQRVADRTAELKATSDQLRDTLEEIQALDRAKTDFFNNVSHELRTPLTLILGPLRDLADGRVPPGGERAAIDTMQRNGERLLRLINQLLDLAKIDAGELRIQRTELDVTELIEAVVAGFRTAAERRDVALRTQTAPLRVSWDAAWVESALTNLVANGLRHVARGGRVEVRLIDRGAEVRLEVEDDGEGMTPKEAARVFERFSQTAHARAGSGTGLGLAIVREAARLHGGEASVRSAPGEGTTFTLSLPRLYGSTESRRPPPPPDLASVGERAATLAGASGRAPASESDVPLAGEDAPVALIVEDNPDLRRYITEILHVSYRVRAAEDGASALSMVREHTPDVVVSDVAMPRMDGYQLTRALRAQDSTRTVPVVLVTAAGDLSRVLEGFDAGANDYITKPFYARELLARVDVHVQLRRMVGEVARRERLAMLGTVAASVAHQIRNPLTTLVSGLPAMRRRAGPQLDDASRAMLETMLDCAERIQTTTNDLLDLSRVDRAKQGAVRPAIGLLAAVRLAATRLVSSDVTLDVEVDEHATLNARAGDLNQVFLNLLDNAAREVAHGGTLRVRGQVEDQAYVVRIADSGRGVPVEHAAQIFEPFWTSRPAGQGTGLGLSVARQVVEQHGGSIQVGDSELGGAQFTVRLPMTLGSSTVH